MTMEDDFWSKSTVAIIGLGLMGGSLAKAMRGRSGKLIGYDRNEAVLNKAIGMGLLDDPCQISDNSLAAAHIIILAVPVMSIIGLLKKLPQLQPNPALVIDLGSTKRRVVEQMNRLPPRFDAIGGHPMCGKEKSGLEHADEGLFENAPFVFTETKRTQPSGKKTASNLAAMLGSQAIWMDAHQHDSWVASTSHLPFLVASCLAAVTPAAAAPLASSGFSSTTRLASSSLQMMMDILSSNRDNILKAAVQFRDQVEHIVNLLEQENDMDLKLEFIRGASNMEKIMERKFKRNEL